MPGTLIGTAHGERAGFYVDVTIGSVQIGDLLVVSAGADVNNGPVAPVSWTISDGVNPDAIYKGGFFDIEYRGQVIAWYGVSTVAGSLTIRMTETVSRDHYAIAANYRGAPGFDQVVIPMGNYTPTDTINFEVGNGTAAFTVADSLVVSFAWVAGGGAPHTIVSDTGDTREALSPSSLGNANLAMFDRVSTGPGSERVEIKVGPVQSAPWKFDANLSLVTMVFTQPLPRPPGLTAQYALRPGSGFDNVEPCGTLANGPVGLPVNRPLTASLPYAPNLGDLITVRVAGSLNHSQAVSDPWGNVYTLRIDSSGVLQGLPVAIYTAILATYPGGAIPFQVTLTATPPVSGAVYQTTALGVSAHTIPGTPTNFQGAGLASVVDMSPSVKMVTDVIASVPKNSLLLAMAYYGGRAAQTRIDWSALETYSITASWGMIQYAGQQTNRPRLGSCVMFDQIAPADGSYDAEVLGTVIGSFANEGGVALIAVTLPTSLTLVKHVVGGSANNNAWTLHAVSDNNNISVLHNENGRPDSIFADGFDIIPI